MKTGSEKASFSHLEDGSQVLQLLSRMVELAQISDKIIKLNYLLSHDSYEI